MNSKDWLDMARVFRTGAASHAQYSYNTERQQQAEALEAQATMCEAISREHAAQERRPKPEVTQS